MSEISKWDWMAGTFEDPTNKENRTAGEALSGQKRPGTQEAKDQAEAEVKKRKEAEQKALSEQDEEKKTARQRFLAQASSGFGANSSVARSFLTSL